MVNQEMHSVKQNFTDLVKEVKVDISDDLKSSEKQIEAIEAFEKANNLADKLDIMNEMSEMTSLRLQMMMDRRSKLISTLSNIMRNYLPRRRQ
jgi:flagellar hook-basal body complex protein FliE